MTSSVTKRQAPQKHDNVTRHFVQVKPSHNKSKGERNRHTISQRLSDVTFIIHGNGKLPGLFV